MSTREQKCCDFCNKHMTPMEQETRKGEDICDSCLVIYREARNEAWEEMGNKYPVAVKYTMMLSEVLTSSKFEEKKIVKILGQKGVDCLKAVKDCDLTLLKGIDDGTIVYDPIIHEPEETDVAKTEDTNTPESAS